MRIFRRISLLVIIFILPFNLAAEDDIQVLVDEIQALADKSRQERAADRWLQIALEDLVAKYNFPWKNSLLSDDFADGDYTSGVQWQIDSGEFWVDRRLGLRSQVVETIDNSRQQPAQQQQDKSDEDIGRALIGAFLQEALGPKNSSQPSQPAEPETRTRKTVSAIRTAVAIPTTFAVEAIFSQNNRPGEPGHFEWVVMQDLQASNAYKLIVTTGQKAMMDVVRIRGGRESYVETIEIPGVNDGGEHTLSWRQKGDGSIEVFLDGEQVVQASDRGFKYGFKYLAMSNQSGDFSVSAIEVLGGR